ncbi:helix-turn-helix transcriptional regulator [Govanella unica]|uniref:AlpA family phage regulatory protein n=1 Tax=Govanella unica TaxID=2975056 RepID=A0A9X3TVZ3_9PROT|nr:AlpA family phage regulatory protein [Govania unica]
MNDRLLRIQDVIERTALSRAHIYARVKEGRFPAPYKLSTKCARWSEREVNDWINSQLS